MAKLEVALDLASEVHDVGPPPHDEGLLKESPSLAPGQHGLPPDPPLEKQQHRSDRQREQEHVAREGDLEEVRRHGDDTERHDRPVQHRAVLLESRGEDARVARPRGAERHRPDRRDDETDDDGGHLTVLHLEGGGLLVPHVAREDEREHDDGDVGDGESEPDLRVPARLLAPSASALLRS